MKDATIHLLKDIGFLYVHLTSEALGESNTFLSGLGWCPVNLMLCTQLHSSWWNSPAAVMLLDFSFVWVSSIPYSYSFQDHISTFLEPPRNWKPKVCKGTSDEPSSLTKKYLEVTEGGDLQLPAYFSLLWDYGFSVWGCGSSCRGLFLSLTFLVLFVDLIFLMTVFHFLETFVLFLFLKTGSASLFPTACLCSAAFSWCFLLERLSQWFGHWMLLPDFFLSSKTDSMCLFFW